MNMKDLNFCLFGGGGLVKVMVFIIMHFQQDFRYFVIVSFTALVEETKVLAENYRLAARH
jgi:hypothetical protein